MTNLPDSWEDSWGFSVSHDSGDSGDCSDSEF